MLKEIAKEIGVRLGVKSDDDEGSDSKCMWVPPSGLCRNISREEWGCYSNMPSDMHAVGKSSEGLPREMNRTFEASLSWKIDCWLALQ